VSDKPAAPDPAFPDEPQTSVHAQTVGPKPEDSDAPEEPSDRTVEEESLRRAHSEAESQATERRRDEP
jgi:hypothetical protein